LISIVSTLCDASQKADFDSYIIILIKFPNDLSGNISKIFKFLFKMMWCTILWMTNLIQVPPINKRQRISQEVIEDIVHFIGKRFSPQKIILFGSYAYGTPRAESDIDLLVVLDSPMREIDQALEIQKFIRPLFALDILVYSPEKLAHRISLGDSFLIEITTKGKLLYESPDS
jgi:predicted nucleotidyltransferase